MVIDSFNWGVTRTIVGVSPRYKYKGLERFRVLWWTHNTDVHDKKKEKSKGLVGAPQEPWNKEKYIKSNKKLDHVLSTHILYWEKMKNITSVGSAKKKIKWR